MAILTKTGNPVKGTPYTIQLNKADLIANSVVANDSYFNTFDVWKTIAVHYKSATGNQSINLIFDATQNTPEFILNLPSIALPSFEVKSIIIYDFDNGYLQIPASSLTVGDFNLTVGEPVIGGPETYEFFMVRPTARQEGVPLGYGDIEGISCTEIFADFGSGYEQITNAIVSWSGAEGNPNDLINGNKEALGTQNLVYKAIESINLFPENGIVLQFSESTTISGFRYYAESNSFTPAIIRNIPSEVEVLGSNDGINFTLIKLFQLDPVTPINGELYDESQYGDDWKLEDGWAKYVDLTF